MSTPSPAHADIGPPSPWVARFAPLLRPGGTVLDLACGTGRHARWLAQRGLSVVAADRDPAALAALSETDGISVVEADLEAGTWPFEAHRFDIVLVTNYLYRPRFPKLLDCVAPGGFLIYETFMLGNARFGKPSNPDFLLAPGELLERLDRRFQVVAFEQGETMAPKPAMLQRLWALQNEGGETPLPRIDQCADPAGGSKRS